jgi:hypothetical protein
MDSILRNLADKFDKIILDPNSSWRAGTDEEHKHWGSHEEYSVRLRLLLGGQPVTLENVQTLWRLFSVISAAERVDGGYTPHTLRTADWRNIAAIDSCIPFLKTVMDEAALREFVGQYNVGQWLTDITDIPYGTRELETL